MLRKFEETFSRSYFRQRTRKNKNKISKIIFSSRKFYFKKKVFQNFQKNVEILRKMLKFWKKNLKKYFQLFFSKNIF